MNGSKEAFALALAERFPEFRMAYQEHLEDYGEILGHVFFDVLHRALVPLLKINEDGEKIRGYIGFLEDMYANGDEDVRNIVEVTILEVLGDDETVVRNAFLYFSENLMTAAQAVEKGWGRRDIRIWHKSGRVRYDWDWPQRPL